MRRNLAFKEIGRIEGGVVAPTGFFASGVCEHPTKWNYAFVSCPKKAVVAVEMTAGKTEREYLSYLLKKVSQGKAKTVAIADGTLGFNSNEELLFARELSYAASRVFHSSEGEVLPFIIGGMGRKISPPTPMESIRGLTLSPSGEKAVEGLSGLKRGIQIAASFYLGDVLCKFGCLLKGRNDFDGDAFSMVITTDVNVTAEMLQKAVHKGVKEGIEKTTFAPSLSSGVIAMASGQAGNYIIHKQDTDFNKFSTALELFIKEVVKEFYQSEGTHQAIECIVLGAKSTKEAQEMAKSIVAVGVERWHKGELCVGGMLSTIALYVDMKSVENLQGYILSEKGKLHFLEGGRSLPIPPKTVQEYLYATNGRIVITVGSGNYSASIFTSLPKEKE